MAPQGWWFVSVAPLVGCTSAAWPLFMDCPLWPPGWWDAHCGRSWLTERSLWPPQIDGQLVVGPPGWWAARCGPSRLKERSLWTFSVRETLVVDPRLVGGSLWTPPSGWWAAHCGPSMLKERSLWPPDWWAARVDPPQVGGQLVVDLPC
ncbi:uncharacterized protein LOC143203919 [Rhynchophorus ferrugineus]|uniref:uncharacterized protein LOC143203919 n=1 Tax=Rhynchophorus ferrugineus TaxID=354439 RepID=UPI003FCDA1A8